MDWICKAFNVVVDFFKNNWKTILTFMINPFAGAFKILWDKCEGFRNFWIGLWDGIKETIDKAKNKIGQAIDKIKNFFNITLKFKGIKTPKIEIEWSKTPKWMAEAAEFLGMKGVPKFNVKWNAEGAIFKEPTIFNTPNGLQGVGEAGAEAVVPIDKLQGYVSTAFKEEVSGIENKVSKIENTVSGMGNKVSGIETLQEYMKFWLNSSHNLWKEWTDLLCGILMEQ